MRRNRTSRRSASARSSGSARSATGLSPGSDLVLASMGPGPELAAELARVCAADLSDAELIDVIRARERQSAWDAGGQLEDLMEFARRRRESGTTLAAPDLKVVPDEFAVDEVAAALTLTALSATRRLMLAVDVSQRMPRALDALRAGRIDLPKLRVMDEETTDLPDEVAALLAAEVLPDAPVQTTGQLRYRLRRLARAYLPAEPDLSPEDAEAQARQDAEAAQNVHLRDLGNGNSELAATMGAGDAATAWAIIDNAAAAAKTAGDTRSIGQRRAAALKDLLHRATEGGTGTGTGTGQRTIVNVTMKRPRFDAAPFLAEDEDHAEEVSSRVA